MVFCLRKKKLVCLLILLILFIMTQKDLDFYVDIYRCGFDPYKSGHCFFDSHTHDFEYLIVEPNICGSDHIFLLMIVPSAPSEFETRKVIRRTWGSVAAEKNSTIKLVFMLGYSADVKQENIYEESRQYRDIIQENFHDTYHNLSIKSEAILRYTATFCSSAKYVLKVDVDIFLNLPPLLDYLKQMKETHFVLGLLHHKANPVLDRTSKWFSAKNIFPLSVYPDYLSGTAYVMSQSVILDLYLTSLQTKIFWLEDVYITGIVRERASVPLIPHPAIMTGKLPIDICSFTSINQISAHRYSHLEIAKLWSQKIEGKPCPLVDQKN